MAHILPTKERQVRPLSSLTPKEQTEAWIKAVEVAGGKVPSSRQVHDNSCTIQTYKGEILVSNQYLESMNYTPSETEQAQQLYQRLWKLRAVEPSDAVAHNLLNQLEKQHTFSLTPVQEQLLQTLESYYL